MQLTELAMFTDDVAGMTAFYRRLLGVEPVAVSADMAVFRAGPTQLFIHRTYTPAADDLPPENHVAFSVSDVDAACRAMAAAGLVIERPPHDYYWGRSAYLRDPDGHLIELTAAA